MKHEEMHIVLDKVKNLLKEEVTNITFTTWIQPLEFHSAENNTITLITNNQFGQARLSTSYYDLFVNAFKEVTNKIYKFEFLNAENMVQKEVVTSSYRPNISLNPKYTFDTFVVGDNNRFAQAAALAVAESPGDAYNPMLLYGGVGLGKTHLMHAIGNYIVETDPAKKILYVTSETFTNDFINCIKDNSNENFRNKYRNIDVLLIDDIQFIAGKKQVQEEFFHTFNSLHEKGGQIIMSSDRTPKEIDLLEDRLKSRFEWGLMADVSNADYETRLAILRKKVQLDNIFIDDTILSNIAIKVDSNIRELEGTLNKIVAKASLTHKPISPELADECINEVVSQKGKVVSSDTIKDAVCKYFNIDVKDMNGSKRSNDIAFPRQIAMYLCRDIIDLPFKQIGNEFGKRDHTTVMHACTKIDSEIKDKNSPTKTIVDNVRNFILNKN